MTKKIVGLYSCTGCVVLGVIANKIALSYSIWLGMAIMTVTFLALFIVTITFLSTLSTECPVDQVDENAPAPKELESEKTEIIDAPKNPEK